MCIRLLVRVFDQARHVEKKHNASTNTNLQAAWSSLKDSRIKRIFECNFDQDTSVPYEFDTIAGF